MAKEAKEIELEFGALGEWVKRNWHWVLLGLILVLAGTLRGYHAGAPVTGYHNWKEVHYLTEARNFAQEGFFAHGFFVPAFDYPDPDKDLSGAHSDSFPTISITIAILFKFFGESLLIARWVGILFNLGAILYMYLLVKQLFKRDDLALTTAAVMAINPLLVFFSRNVQLESPALFFMIAAAYYGARWHAHENKHDLLFGAAMLTAAVLTRYDYAIIVFPLLTIFPWKRAKQLVFHPETRYWWAIGALLLCIVPLWFWYSNFHLPSVLPGEVGAVYGGIIDFGKPFHAEYWQSLKPYFADNFTFTGLGMVIFGLAAFLALWKGGAGSRFMLGFLLALIPWTLIMADKLSGHSYHMFPIVPIFAFLIAYGFTVIGSTLAQFLKHRAVHVIVVLLLIGWLYVPSTEAADRQFNTQFFGLEIAGDYIRTHSEPNERVFHSSHQNYGVLWHADRKGFKNPGTLVELELGEQYNASWIFMYQWGFNLMEREVWNDIRQRYHPVQFAFIQNGQQVQPFFVLLREGGSFDEQQLNNAFQNRQIQERAYELTDGNKFTLRYIDLE